MDFQWGDEKSQQFITNVGLITSDGPHGPNIMACEWTHHISYSPGLIALSLGLTKATLENIRKTKQFGVNIASVEQSVMASVSGGSSGRDTDKIAALKELGFSFFPSRRVLSQHYPFVQQLDSVDEMYALLVTGRKEMIDLGNLDLEKITKLILPDPKSSSLKNFIDSLEHVKDPHLVEKEIKTLTDRLMGLNPGSVRWCKEFLGFTLLIGNPKSAHAWAQIDWIPPFIEPSERLVFRVERAQNKKLFDLCKGLFGKIWDDYIVELNDIEEPKE